MKILYIGCVKSSHTILQKLVDNRKNVVGIITKKQSNFNSDFCDLSDIAVSEKIDYMYVNSVNENLSVEFIKDKKPDIIYCFGWSELIGREILNIPRLGVVGMHPAKLPKNRGRHPIIWALALGLRETASTFFLMDEKADSGNIISQESITIDYQDDAASLYDKILAVACGQVIKFTDAFCNNTIELKDNVRSNSNYWRKRTAKDGEIDWRMSSYNIYNLVRALTVPYVGAHFVYNNQQIKVWRVEEIITDEYQNIEPGKVLSIDSENKSIIIKAGDNLVRVKDCVVEGLSEGDYL